MLASSGQVMGIISVDALSFIVQDPEADSQPVSSQSADSLGTVTGQSAGSSEQRTDRRLTVTF
eukprot:277006-Prorocentrum_minimum.AAC.3